MRDAPQVRRWTRARSARALPVVLALSLAVGTTGVGLATASTSSATATGKVDPGLLRVALAHPATRLPVIVREAVPSSSFAENLTRSLGGHVTHELPLIHGFSATIPARAAGLLAASASVLKVWGDAAVHVLGVNMGQYDSSAPNTVWRSEMKIPQANQTYDGAGVAVATLDTGIVPTPDFGTRIVAAADFTSEGDGLDRYGHGTHMAGIIAGNGAMSNGAYAGIAPKASIVSVKVAGWDGSTDVSVVIAGLQWIVANRTRLNIRVLNLSFGTDSKQPYSIDPLDYAVEQTWFSGIFVVVSAGNAGPGAATITKPGDDPYVLTVGAEDTGATSNMSDDALAQFSSAGPTQDGLAKPDVVAAGITILSVRDTGSTIDQLHPSAVYATYYFKGTGTSQAAAIVSGIAALMFQANPALTPNAAKATIIGTARSLAAVPGTGAGMVDAAAATAAAATKKYVLATQSLVPSTGLGSLEASRGSAHVYVDLNGDGQPELLTGEQGYGWSAGAWSAGSWSGQTWTASSWSAGAWSAGAWSAGAWSAGAWSAGAWSAGAWSAGAWSASAWSAGAWSAGAWSAGAWSGSAWSAGAWSAGAWSAGAWSAGAWSVDTWS